MLVLQDAKLAAVGYGDEAIVQAIEAAFIDADTALARAAQLAFDQMRDDGDGAACPEQVGLMWNDACRHIATAIRELKS